MSSQYKIEELLEQMGSIETDEETKHRHALRRCLLSSQYFEMNRLLKRRMFLFVIPFFAGGLLLTVLVVMNISQKNMAVSPTPSQAEPIAVVSTPSFSTEGLLAKYVDDRPMIPVNRVINTVSFHPVGLAISQ